MMTDSPSLCPCSSSSGPMSGELVSRELAGAGELEALLRTALADAMFALASGTVEDYRAGPGPVPQAVRGRSRPGGVRRSGIRPGVPERRGTVERSRWRRGSL